MFLGTRRDTGEPIDIKPMVLARHAAMLGSTGSGKTVMAKALIEEAALAKIPSLIIDPQGDLARLALGIDLDELESQGGDVVRAKKLMEMCEVRVWTPLRSKGLPLCIDPFRAPPSDLDTEEAITAWDMVAAGFTSLAGYDVEKAQGKVEEQIFIKHIKGPLFFGSTSDFQALAKQIPENATIVLVRMGRMPYMDQSGLYVMEEVLIDLVNEGKTVLLVNTLEQPKYMMERIDIIPDLIPKEQLFY